GCLPARPGDDDRPRARRPRRADDARAPHRGTIGSAGMTAQFDALVAQAKATIAAENARAVPRISVGVSGCSVCVGAEETLRILRAEMARRNLDAIVEVVGCRGVDYA